MAKKGVTRWHLTCRCCGIEWTVRGRGEWVAPKVPPPEFWTEGEFERDPWTYEHPRELVGPGIGTVSRNVHRAVVCNHCRRHGYRTPEELLNDLEKELRRAKRTRPGPSGMKVCVHCLNLFKASRADQQFCSPRCREASHRQLKKLRRGESPSWAMRAHRVRLFRDDGVSSP